MPHCRLWFAIPPELTKIRPLAAAVRGLLAELECTEELAFMIELCVVEAVNNAVEHAYEGIPKGRIELVVTLMGDTLQLSVSDKGRSMPAGTLERARAQEPRGVPAEGGYGLGIILSLMQDVTYRVSEDRNVLTMSTTLEHKAAAPRAAAG